MTDEGGTEMADVKIEGLTQRYPNGYVALKALDLEIGSGELVVLVGPSGCGKSTLLRAIAGLEPPTSGRVLIGGHDVTQAEPGRRGLAMVFQDYALYPHMTVRDNLAFGLKMRKLGKPEIQKRIAGTAALLGIEPLLSRRPAELSGGQRQRVAIGRAIVKEPSVFLFDEPLSNLDAKLRLHTRTEIAALHRRLGATSIYVTHDQGEAMTLGDRIVILNAGEIVQQGTPLEIYHRPVNRFVATFIGSPEMNLLEGESVTGQGAFRHRGERILLPPTATQGVGGPAVLGFRPESVFIAQDPGISALAVRVLRTEPQGHESHLIAELAGSPIVLRTSDPAEMHRLAELRPGDTLALGLKPEGILWFETGSKGRRI
jgi:ABC-type sugar transport system ATPase subunit